MENCIVTQSSNKTVINPSWFFLIRQCESLDWSDCLVVLLLWAIHFPKSGHARLIRGCFSFSQCFRAGVFSSLSRPLPLPLTRPISSSLREVSPWRFREQIARSKKTPALQAVGHLNLMVKLVKKGIFFFCVCLNIYRFPKPLICFCSINERLNNIIEGVHEKGLSYNIIKMTMNLIRKLTVNE